MAKKSNRDEALAARIEHPAVKPVALARCLLEIGAMRPDSSKLTMRSCLMGLETCLFKTLLNG